VHDIKKARRTFKIAFSKKSEILLLNRSGKFSVVIEKGFAFFYIGLYVTVRKD
jgi:hypothetical protein